MAILHDPATHELGERHWNVKTWHYCGTKDCFAVVCGECNHTTCVCGMTDEEIKEKNDKQLMRDRSRPPARSARKVAVRTAALAIWSDDELVSTSTTETEALEGAERPQEGRDMVTKTEEKQDGRKTKPKEDRRGKGELEALVIEVTNAFEAGKVDLDGKPLTPQRIATIIGEKPGEEKPSAGAVNAILKRWDEAGYALTDEKPYAFKRLSAAGKKQGLDALKQKLREKKKAEKAAAKGDDKE